MPQAIDNAVCGPLKPGSQPPTDGQTLADLNPCPLNACCTTWGQCGITPEFCNNDTTAATGNPGTAPPGRSGCISNCGTDIKNDSTAGPVSSPISIGYYESWNFDRRCLNMRVDSVDTSKYTHYHWAFAAIDPTTFEVSINDTYNQWSRFTGLTGIKRIVSPPSIRPQTPAAAPRLKHHHQQQPQVSLGGYSFSTDPSTASIFRAATHPTNASLFASNIAAFLALHNLDGIDIDWEYPSNPDLPSPSPSSDGPYYLSFIALLRASLPANTTLSIAAPASYWYLRAFPIAAIASVVDYIAYMTYDLHGQWDVGAAFAQSGCPAGNCLRSHVNLTETMWALGMVTKAGVPAAKVAVGLAAYGRSFGMREAGCDGPECAFDNDTAAAWAMASCTQTRGLVANAEIEVMREVARRGTRAWFDEGSGSDVLVYGDGARQWVAYMGEETRGARKERYRALGFAGTADWAVDLLSFGDDERDPEGDARRPVPAGGR
ncbi:Killer toxin subunits alpha/beta [Diplodia seriata]|uniref:chitinase n=1 Tax=Diplodia seriata TaxID=420778 RepID=A0A1S8B9G0_9PEZI|nr:Killer toxin subunits alpha/beta [Diplodia seriata]